jgi:hypothetical protein
VLQPVTVALLARVVCALMIYQLQVLVLLLMLPLLPNMNTPTLLLCI